MSGYRTVPHFIEGGGLGARKVWDSIPEVPGALDGIRVILTVSVMRVVCDYASVGGEVSTELPWDNLPIAALVSDSGGKLPSDSGITDDGIIGSTPDERYCVSLLKIWEHVHETCKDGGMDEDTARRLRDAAVSYDGLNELIRAVAEETGIVEMVEALGRGVPVDDLLA